MIGAFIRRLYLRFRRRRAADDLAEEMRLHLEFRTAANRREGLDDHQAALRARRTFGNVLRLREESQDMWGFGISDRLARDARYACRQLARQPGWTAAVVMTLALGIGANTSIFTVINALLFRPAPGQHPDRLVWVAASEGQSGQLSYLSYAAYADLRERTTTLSGLLAYGTTELSVGGDRAERVTGAVVSGNYFDVLGVRPAIGRTFEADEDTTAGAHPVVVLSDGMWRDRFGADMRIAGATLTINGHPFTVIGVAPAGFVGVELGERVDVWVPMAMQRQAMPSAPTLLAEPGARWLRVVGRLRDGVPAAEADAETLALSKTQVVGGRPEDARLVRVVPIRGGLAPSNRSELVPVFALVSIVPALVLAVACFNIANVLMARNVGRRKEFAMRRAIGATRARLLGQLLVESLVLALLAAGSAFVVSFGLTALIAHLGDVPGDVASVLRPDVRVLAATTVLAVLTSLVFGLAPALTATRFDLLPVLKAEGPTSTPDSGRHRLRSGFVVAQIAVSLALLITAGLFLMSLSKAMNVDPGFEPRGAVTLSVDPMLQNYTTDRRAEFVTRLRDAASALPMVTAASVTSRVPLSGRSMGTDVLAEGTQTEASATFSSVAPQYFEAMRIDLLRGRDFTASDVSSAPPVAIVNQTLARRLWPNADAIGKRFRADGRNQPWREVVGVARDGKYVSLTETPRGAFYLPMAQHPASPITLVVRTAGDAGELMRRLTGIVQGLDRDMPIFSIQTLEDNTRQVVDRQRAAASLLGVFGTIAVLLAAVGIYGVAAHTVSLRIREIGIRMALGARAASVLWMFVRETLKVTVVGVVLGLTLSAAASRALSAFLFDLRPTDAIAFSAAATIVSLVAVLASYVPARRAAHVNPLRALRQD